jgi:REP element-mobilizing transposase RayT
VFFEDGDYALYLDLLSDAAARTQVAIWAYCLMPNHVRYHRRPLAPGKRGPKPKAN